MRTGSALSITLLVLALVAWIHDEAAASLRVVVLESLSLSNADIVLPAFARALDRRLATDGRVAAIERLRIGPDAVPPAFAEAQLSDADLVVTFGSAATEAARAALRGAATPHLFAFVPYGMARAVTSAAADTGSGPVVGMAAQSPRGTALAIAEKLLSTRSGPPLRVGFVHPLIEGRVDTTMTLLTETLALPGFVPVPFAAAAAQGDERVQAHVLAAIDDATAGSEAFDAFWLAIEPLGPLDALIEAIERRTGRPVFYAPSETAVAAGALMSLSVEPESTAAEAAALARRILAGELGAGTPIRTPRRVAFALNLTTAGRLGIVPPHELMELAHGRLFR